jgi:small subunit ribosomal protein S27Ae
MSKKEKKEAEKATKTPEATKEKLKEEAPVKETPKIEAKPEKAAKAEKKKKPDKKIHTLFKVEGAKLTRLLPTCERCGTGYYMADHGNRYTCGHCGFTRYKHSENGHV